MIALRGPLLFALCALAAGSAGAAIRQTAVICPSGICPRWWPVLPAVAGWHQDEERSAQDGINAQVRDGDDFDSAEAVVYARAVLKTEGGAKLEDFVARDQAETRDASPGVRIKELRAIRTAAGQRLRSFAFTPHEGGNFEIVSYGEEGDWYVLFAISATSPEALARHRDAYLEFVRRYESTP